MNQTSEKKEVTPWYTCSEEGEKTLELAKKAAKTELSIYISGETGTGKEILSHLIHLWSPRKEGPFIPIHCGALPLSLVESELFGHTRGAFTGATHQRNGALLKANKGTLFLDEIGDLPLEVQVKLLRFLENGEIRPVGSDRTYSIDARLICATHHSLEKLVRENKFRKDLYYRIASLTISIPSLRTRPEDIALLAEEFASYRGKTLSPGALMRLQNYSWPGNVRELRHAVERGCSFEESHSHVLTEISFEFLLPQNKTQYDTPLSLHEPDIELPVLALRDLEKIAVLKALEKSKGNRSKTARLLGIARSTLFEMLKRHEIE